MTSALQVLWLFARVRQAWPGEGAQSDENRLAGGTPTDRPVVHLCCTLERRCFLDVFRKPFPLDWLKETRCAGWCHGERLVVHVSQPNSWCRAARFLIRLSLASSCDEREPGLVRASSKGCEFPAAPFLTSNVNPQKKQSPQARSSVTVADSICSKPSCARRNMRVHQAQLQERCHQVGLLLQRSDTGAAFDVS